MNCSECQEKLIFIIHNEMDILDTIPFHEHMATCETCREEYQNLLEVVNVVESEFYPLNNEGIGENRLEEIKISIPQNKQEIKFPYWIYTVAASLAITFILLVVISKNDHSANMVSLPEEKRPEEKTPSGDILGTEPASAEHSEFGGSLSASAGFEKKLSTEDGFGGLGMRSPPPNSKTNIKESSNSSLSDKKSGGAVNETSIEIFRNEVIGREAAGSIDSAKSKSQADTSIETSNSVPAVEIPPKQIPTIISTSENSLVEGSGINVEYLQELIKEALASKAIEKNSQDILKQLAMKKGWTFSVIPDSTLKSNEKATEKILVKKVKKNKMGIDFAYIFVHNGKIIRVELIKQE